LDHAPAEGRKPDPEAAIGSAAKRTAENTPKNSTRSISAKMECG